MTAKARAMQAQGIDVLSFAAGEPDFNTPGAICEAAISAIESGLTKYCPSKGLPQLREAIRAKVQRENGFSCGDDQIVVSCGAKHSLYNALQVLVEPGDEVILIAPYWMTYADQIRLAGGTPVVVSTTAATSYTPHIDQIKEALSPRTKAIIVNTPCNPTGAAWDRGLIKEVAALALKHGIWIISDEIYERLIYGHAHTSFASLSKEVAAQTITVQGCSKTYSMTGWRIGFSIAPANVTSAMANLQDQVTSNATTFAQAGAIEALNLDPAIVEEMRVEFETRRDMGLELLRAIPDVSVTTPLGAFYFFVDISKHLGGSISDDVALAEWLLENAHIATVPGSVFEGPGHLRLSYAAHPDEIREGIARLQKGLTELPS